MVLRHEVDQPTIEAERAGLDCVAQLNGVAHDCLEHGLHVGRRARDDFEDVGRRRLLLQRLG